MIMDSKSPWKYRHSQRARLLDNRAGCAMLIEALRQMKDVKATVHAAYITVQKEVG